MAAGTEPAAPAHARGRAVKRGLSIRQAAQGIADREVGYARIETRDTVLEVGAGIGNLTARLARQAAQGNAEATA